jgi:hypothetical protein
MYIAFSIKTKDVGDQMRKIVIIAMLLVLLNSCQRIKDPMSPEPKPGSRNYVWELDTLDMPMNMIMSVWGASPKDVWAVGPGGTQYDRLQHYDGVQWSTYAKEVIWCSGGTLYGFSADNVWMGGGAGWLAHGAGIWHFDGTEWSQNYVYDIKGSYLMEVCDIWGPNPNDLYACGVISFFDGITEDMRGFVLHYDGRNWKEIVRAQFNSQFLTVRKELNSVYIFSYGINYETGDGDLEFYELSNNQLKKIFSEKESQIHWASLHTVNDKVYFVINRDIYRFVQGKFAKSFSIGNENFGHHIYGRNENDLFLRMKDGLAHYNGMNIEYLYKFPMHSINIMSSAILFEKDVFFCGITEDNLSLILHGTIKE